MEGIQPPLLPIEISEERRRMLEQLALTGEEYGLIVSRLGREPNDLELGMFGALWSEHCGYKHSKPLLRKYGLIGPPGLYVSEYPDKTVISLRGGDAGVVLIGDDAEWIAEFFIKCHSECIKNEFGEWYLPARL